MQRDKAKDEQWLRDVIARAGMHETVYISTNHYDGGYELRVGTQDVFVEYDAIDAKDERWIERLGE